MVCLQMRRDETGMRKIVRRLCEGMSTFNACQLSSGTGSHYILELRPRRTTSLTHLDSPRVPVTTPHGARTLNAVTTLVVHDGLMKE
jgi:hypothetical protein